MRSGEEIQAALTAFARKWADYQGTERGEAQTFLNELFASYGVDRKDTGAVFEDSQASSGIMDLHLPGVVIIEMKAPHRADKLAEHRQQLLDYWRHSSDAATGRAAPPYVVLCAFHRFEVWEPGRFPDAPRAAFSLGELPERYETLLFLAGTGQEPLFEESYKHLTTEAATAMGELFAALMKRQAAPPEEIQRFVLQVVWCLFAEDLGMLDGHPVQRIVDQLLATPEMSSYSLLGSLFDVLNDPEDHGRHGLLAGTRYVNGSLFAKPAKVHLEQPELRMLHRAAEFDWRNVDPTIFGSLMESCLGHEQRWKLGAHYTHEADIMKIVGPTIVRPWRERLDATTSPAEARQVLDDLCSFRVLDPACGCGNFLYVAYRELRALEQAAKARIRELATQSGQVTGDADLPYYPLRNLLGIEIEPVTASIARITLWMGHKQMTDRYGPAEPVLPLVDLSGIQVGDALALPWPDCDAIVGNPPFLGSQWIRGARGDTYVAWLKSTFGVGIKDYCAYWFRRAHEHLSPGQRAGLVGTNSVSQNRARSASLEYLAANGGVITDAVSTQKWPGEAKVHVSLVNWVKDPEYSGPFLLDATPVAGITAELRSPERSTGDVARLAANAGRCFQGPIPVGEGFIISASEAAALHARTDADYPDVVRPYLTGEDIAHDPGQQPTRWIIDFAQLPLEQAMRYPAALEIVESRVRPKRLMNNRKLYRERWWLFGENRPGLRNAVADLTRFLANGATGKRLAWSWQARSVSPSNLTNVAAFDDDFAIGVLTSRAHSAWAWSRSSTLKGDLRYTPTTVFETFPWPYPVTDAQREDVATASRDLLARRSAICQAEQIGLTTLYNRMDEGAYADLKDLHRRLDVAVAAAYGWPASVAQDDDELVRRLLELNRAISAGDRPYDPFGDAPAPPPELPLS